MSVQINPKLCPQDHKCPALASCPNAALSQEGVKAPTIDQEKCSVCGTCVAICPKSALYFGD